MLAAEVGDDVENSGVGALWVILQNAHIYVLKAEEHKNNLVSNTAPIHVLIVMRNTSQM